MTCPSWVPMHSTAHSFIALHKSLHHGNLSSNRLTTLSWLLFKTLRLIELRLDGNSFNCSCDIRWIQLWQEKGEANMQNQDLHCMSLETNRIPIKKMNISHCGHSPIIHMSDLPEISVSHVNLTVCEGENAVITCNGSGSPLPDVDWTVVNLRSINTHQTNANWTNVHSINLTLVNVTSEDNGFLLTCIAENVVGMSNASVLLTVYYPPRVISLLEPIRQMEHCIEFLVHGNPPPQIHWLYNGQLLRETDFIRMELYQEGEVSDGCLLFNHPTHYNNGNYTIVATNYLGTANQTVKGHFLEKPFPSERLAAFHSSSFPPCPSEEPERHYGAETPSKQLALMRTGAEWRTFIPTTPDDSSQVHPLPWELLKGTIL
ncbi:NT-3 growth factor receptor [Varanus komodoensis]|nr:NT-3 growth factor receptor [Varanus komodoensis]